MYSTLDFLFTSLCKILNRCRKCSHCNNREIQLVHWSLFCNKKIKKIIQYTYFAFSGTNICLNTAQQPESWKSKCGVCFTSLTVLSVSKAHAELQTSANVIQNGSSLQKCHILVLNSKRLLCGNFPVAYALWNECAGRSRETLQDRKSVV